MKKTTILNLEQVKEIEKTTPTPFHIYDEKAIRANARALKEAFRRAVNAAALLL